MHHYSVNSYIRKTVVTIITLISIIILFVLGLIFNNFGVELLPLPLNINNKTILKMILGLLFKTGSIIGVLYYIFDKWVWKMKYIKMIHKIPDLNGIWEGEFVSNKKDERGNNYNGICRMKIKQTWSKISIKGNFNKSKSYSRIAMIVKDCEGIQLKFEYTNKPDKTVDTNLKTHSGYNTLTYDEEKGTLIGEYYTDRNRQTYGNINVSKQIQSNNECSNT